MAIRKKVEVMKSIRAVTMKRAGGKLYKTFRIYFGTDEFGKEVVPFVPSARFMSVCLIPKPAVFLPSSEISDLPRLFTLYNTHTYSAQ